MSPSIAVWLKIYAIYKFCKSRIYTATSTSIEGIEGTFDVQFVTETIHCTFKFYKGSQPTFGVSDGAQIHSNHPKPEVAGTTANINLSFNE